MAGEENNEILINLMGQCVVCCYDTPAHDTSNQINQQQTLDLYHDVTFIEGFDSRDAVCDCLAAATNSVL